MAKRTAGYTSTGIRKIRALEAFLPEFDVISRIGPFKSKPDSVIGWGFKHTSHQARQYASRNGIPYIALEDGFLRSLRLSTEGYQPHSMVVDPKGIYYDASRPSALEDCLNNGTFDTEELQRARHCIEAIKKERLSKYNHAEDRSGWHTNAKVLVVDQTVGDASIDYGGANAKSFDQMLEEALKNHPHDDILVKIHPDVIAGKKQGHLTNANSHPRCHIISNDVNPWALFDQVDTVYVVTSQLGFEALLAEKSVHCFGLPFYAGWGLTQDKLSCPRRQRTLSLEEVFSGAYFRYSRYANPYTGQACTLEETITLIADQKRQQERLRGPWLVCGFSWWKQRFIADFLGPAASVSYIKDIPKALPSGLSARSKNDAQSCARLLVWSSRISDDFKNQHTHLMAHIWRIEDGFIRSVGLGVDLTTPLSLAVDHQGIYFDPTQPSDLEELLNTTDFTAELLARSQLLQQRLVSLKLSKYNVPGQVTIDVPSSQQVILVPGQVESDASIKHGSPEISTNSALLHQVRKANPEAFIIYKAHPDVISKARIGELDSAAKQLYDLDASHIEITSLLEKVDAVHTMSSLTGFEALLRGRQVHTYGLPFYAGWGLTHDAMYCARRTRSLSLDALVAGTLILYPSYIDPHSKQLCNAETAVCLLEQARSQHHSLTWKQRLYRYYRNLLIGSY